MIYWFIHLFNMCRICYRVAMCDKGYISFNDVEECKGPFRCKRFPEVRRTGKWKGYDI